MKLAAKIAIGLVALLGLVFAIGGFAMVGGNFSRGLKSAEANALAGHLAAKESLRAQLAGAVYGGTPLHDATMADWGGQAALALAASGGACAVLNEGYTPCYNNLPPAFGKSVQAAILAQPRYSRLFYRFSGKTYLVFPDKIAAGGARYPFISAFDISALFSERQAQSRGFYTVYGIVLVCAALLAAGLSAYITRPLRRLEKAVQSIAAGAYAQRTGISGKDEIASLAASFDEMAAAVERQVESLTLAARQREDFMSAFTHELKTPMTAMMGYAALLEKGALDEEEKAKALGYIHSETRRLEDLSQKLLMLMGLAEGSVHLKRVRLADVLRRVRGAFPQEGERLTLPESGEAAVRADADLLADLLINLVRNGFEAQPQGGSVQIILAEDEGAITLAVQDYGKGIEAAALPRLTEPFYQVEPGRHSGGSGLGLALCARIAQLHGTALEFESHPRAGTTVRLALQAAKGGEGDEDEAQNPT